MWKFMKLGISPKDLYNRILKGLILMKNLSNSQDSNKANPRLRVKLPLWYYFKS